MVLNKKVKILHIANMNTDSGVACFLMNYVRHLDNQKLDMSFVCWDVRKDNFYEEIKKLGGKVIVIKNYKKSPLAFLGAIRKILKSNRYDIIHAHEAIMSLPFLLMAKRQNIKHRIAHSHNSAMPSKAKDLVVKICRKMFACLCTEYFACSELAGNYLFGEKSFSRNGKVVKNAIELEKFSYSENTRMSVRENMGLKNDFVVGHVGRFNAQKNHDLLIDIFNETLKLKTNAKLLLVGDGEKRAEIENKVKTLGIEQQVVFLGIRKDVEQIMQAMDVFVFPSVFEGLGIVLIEAQASGLKCYASEDVPQEAACGEGVEYISRNLPVSYWASRISSEESFDRTQGITKAVEEGYEISTEARKLEQYYLDLGDRDV